LQARNPHLMGSFFFSNETNQKSSTFYLAFCSVISNFAAENKVVS
jgi:hypothetical protein